MCKITTQTMLRIEMTLQEAEALIVDPEPLVSLLQDALPGSSNGRTLKDNKAHAAKTTGARRGYTLPKRHCDTCGRDITTSRWDRHQARHANMTIDATVDA